MLRKDVKMSHAEGRNEKGMDADKLSQFKYLAEMELKRAERYRNFLSLLILNLSEFLRTAGKRRIRTPEDLTDFSRKLMVRLRHQMRETDIISYLADDRLAMLLPETDSRGAQIAADRFQKLLSEFLAEYLDSDFAFEIPAEVLSYPHKPGEDSMKSRLTGLIGLN
jgi:GGDEF domain-containing protein